LSFLGPKSIYKIASIIFFPQALLKILYTASCCYGLNASGDTENVRQNLTAAEVRHFHRQFYRPDNVCLIVTGKVSTLNLLNGLAEIDRKLFENGRKENPTNVLTIQPFEQNCSTDVSIPTFNKDVESGLVYVGWRGSSAKFEPEKVLASIVLLEYFVNDPLQRFFVEKKFCNR
jgi:Zn-dependent M16 (insulinase) family peptidase